MRVRLALVLLLAAAALDGSVALAQMNNRPYGFGGTGGASGPGMTAAYRQAILGRAQTGGKPAALLRDASGALITVQRGRGGSALLTPTVGAVGSFAAGGGGTTVIMPSAGSASIDAWIGQLDGLQRR